MVPISMMLILTMLVISYVIYKDVVAPPVLVGIPWLAAMFLLSISDFHYDNGGFYFLFFVIGIMVFNFGFLVFLIIKSSNSKRVTGFTNYIIQTNNTLFKIIISLEMMTIAACLIYVFLYIKSNYSFNMYYTLKVGKSVGSLKYFVLIQYLNIFITAFTSCVIYASLKSQKFINRKYLFMQILIGLISSFLTLGRTAILLFVVLNLTIYIITAEVKNRSIVKYGIAFGVVGVILFSFYNLAKYPYLLTSKSALEVATETLSVYASGSLVTFQQWASTNFDLLLGENIFRFWKAVLSFIGFDVNVKPLTNPFINISNNFSSNVYTIYYFYAIDFGLVFSLIIQFIIGIYHGITYKLKASKRPIWMYLFSLSIYPLIMQFFQDQYFSLTSTWIQYLIYGLILFKTNTFIIRKKDMEG